MRFKERLMTFCITKKCSDDKGLGSSGFLLETRTPSIFTNGLANGIKKIPLRACMIQMGYGV